MIRPHFEKDGVTIYHGDLLDVLPQLPEASVDCTVTDPPYGLHFMEKGWDHDVPGPAYWQAIARVCKPGALLLAFGGTRTHHRLACAIEDAGWEIRDCLMWLHGQGFPKSLDISKALDKAAGAVREVVGESRSIDCVERGYTKVYSTKAENSGFGTSRTFGLGIPITAPATPEAAKWNGWGTALKPAWEPIVLAMKPLDGTFARNAEMWGVAGMNIDACRIGTSEQSKGRWPTNLLLDEEAADMLNQQTGVLKSGVMKAGQSARPARAKRRLSRQYARRGHGLGHLWRLWRGKPVLLLRKGTKKQTAGPGNDHPTVKPLELMDYLLTLLSTPTGGVILDPFAGTGTTALAARQLGRRCICVELDKHNCDIAAARLQG